MRLRQLEYFVAVSENGSFRRASEALFVTQPSLSAQIAELEREVGGPLLTRHARGVALTSAGRVFLREAQTTLASLDRAKRFTALALDGGVGEVIFGTVLSIAAGIVPDALSSWQKECPDAQALLHEYRSASDLELATRRGLHDFAIGPAPRSEFAELIPLGHEDFVVVLPPGDPLLANGDAIDIAVLSDRRWVMFSTDHGLSQVVAGLFGDAGINPHAAVYTSQTEVAVRLAIAGLGPTIVPANVVAEAFLHCVRSLEPAFVRELYAYSHAPIPPIATSILTHVSAVCTRKQR